MEQKMLDAIKAVVANSQKDELGTAVFLLAQEWARFHNLEMFEGDRGGIDSISVQVDRYATLITIDDAYEVE